MSTNTVHTSSVVAVTTEGMTYLVPGVNSTRTTAWEEGTTAWGEETTARDDRCEHISTNYSIAPAVICVMCFVFGILYTFFGYRFFKAVMFMTGFIFGSVLVYMICLEEDILPPEGNAGVAIGAGILCGLITMLVQYVGLFLTGFHLGVALGIGVLIVLEQYLHPSTKWIPIGVMVGIGIFLAILILKLQKSLTILGTSIFGGGLMVAFLDYFIEKFIMVLYVWDRIKGEYSEPVCWYSWIILGCWPFCFVVGSVTQWRITGQGIDHREALHGNRTRKVDLKRLRMKERRDAQHSRYRHLYQVRRVNGDVISQSYIQSVQHKLSPALRSLTGQPTADLESANTTLTQLP